MFINKVGILAVGMGEAGVTKGSLTNSFMT